MAKVKIDFERKSVPEQIEKSRMIQKKMLGNVHFPSPNPGLSAINIATNRLETSFQEAMSGDRNKKAEMRIRRKELKELISRLAYYVQHTSGGNEEMILSSGFGLRKKNEKIPAPVNPEAVKVKPPVRENELDIVWKSTKGATFYIIAICGKNLDTELFVLRAVSQKASVKIDGLESGEKYWFRVAAANASGVSGWSEPAAGRVW